tara:strand:- start:2702 stop:3010 length:309 start_codon:yes stop_codon:yes gene_type:complete
MTTYQLEITARQEMNSGIMKLHLSADARRIRDIIEMKHSEYFTWEDDAQESLSRSNAIGYAEKEIQECAANVRGWLWWRITTWRNGHKVEGVFGHAKVVTDE